MPELFGRYRIEEKLGQGGMGIVYRAFDTVLERVVALKMVVTADDMESDLRERFFREARAAAHLSHKNIVTIYDLWEHEGRPCLAMEYLAGEDLQHRLARPEKMSLWRKVDLAIEMCQGMEYAHAHGIVHRDLKPANIFITTGGGVKILDFGLARLASSQLTQSNMLMGTINYLSPEQVRGERADQQSDVFAMGVVLYELFGGRRAFEGNSAAATLYKILQEVPEPLSNVDPSLPRDLISVVDRALAKPRDERYPDMATLRRDLETLRHLAQVAGPASPWPTPLLSGTPQPVPSMPEALASAPTIAQPLPSVAAPGQKSRMPWIAAGAVVVALAGVSVALWLGRQRGQPPASTVASVQSSAETPAVRPPQPTPATPPADTTATPGVDPESASASLSAAAEAARSRMEQSRTAAEAAGARTRVKAAFTKAQQTAQQADRLFKAKKFAEAEARYNVANGLYLGAESAAREPVSADSTKPAANDSQSHATPPVPAPSTPPAAAPPQPSTPATSPASPPASAPAAPPPAAPSSSGGSSSLPTSPIAAPGAPAGVKEVPAEERIRELIDRYKEALESKNMEQLKRIWPSLRGTGEERIRQDFQNATRISVDISSPQIAVSGAAGRVTFVRHYSLVTVDGQRPQSTSDAVMDVRRVGGTWVIDSIQFTPRKMN